MSPARLPRKLASLGAGLLALALSTACRQPPDESLVTFSGEVMGTQFNVRILASGLDRTAGSEVERKVAAELSIVDDLMTTYRESEVTRFNSWRSSEPFAISTQTAEVVTLALDLAAETGGALDVTIAPLVEALGFGAAPRPADLSASEFAALRSRVGYSLLSIDRDGRLRKEIPELTIDLSAVAKGHGVDRVVALLDQLGFVDYMVEVGGEVRTRGGNERGEHWRIGIERPAHDGGADSRQAQRIIPLANMALATSGDYRNYREVDGRRLSHIIDPRTGAPVEHRVASATVLHANCATADGLATAMMVLGEAGLDLAESKGWAVLLIARDDKGFVELESSAFSRLLESTSANST